MTTQNDNVVTLKRYIRIQYLSFYNPRFFRVNVPDAFLYTYAFQSASEFLDSNVVNKYSCKIVWFLQLYLDSV